MKTGLTPYGNAMAKMQAWGEQDFKEGKSMMQAFDLRLGESAKARAFPIKARAAYQQGWTAARELAREGGDK